MGFLNQMVSYPETIDIRNRLTTQQFIDEQVSLLKGTIDVSISSNPNDLLLYAIPTLMDIRNQWIKNVKTLLVIQDGNILKTPEIFDPKKETIFIIQKRGEVSSIKYDIIILPDFCE